MTQNIQTIIPERELNKRTITILSIISASPDQVSSQLGDESVILNIKTGTYFGLNEVGTRIWSLIQKPISIERVIQALLDEYDVDIRQCELDVLNLINDLVNVGLIEVRDEKIIKFFRIEPWEQAVLIQALAVQLMVQIALGILPFRLTLKFLQRIKMDSCSKPMQKLNLKSKHLPKNLSDPQVVAWAIKATSPIVPGSRCLSQAIATQILLALKGYSSELRIGVQKKNCSSLLAHAWVIRQETILIGNLDNISEFVVLPALPRVFK